MTAAAAAAAVAAELVVAVTAAVAAELAVAVAVLVPRLGSPAVLAMPLHILLCPGKALQREQQQRFTVFTRWCPPVP